MLNIGNSIIDKIKEIPTLILNGLKDIFIPDVQEIENIFNATVENIATQLGVQFNTLDNLFNVEVAPPDVNADYEISGLGVLNLKFFDSTYLIKGIAFFRPIIRGFLVLLLVLYNWRQLLTLIGQDPNIAAGAHENYTEWKKGDKE